MSLGQLKIGTQSHVRWALRIEQVFVGGDRVGPRTPWTCGRGADLSALDFSGTGGNRPWPATRVSCLVVWYDASCPLCRREIGLMRRLDKRATIEFIDVAATQALDCPIDRSALLARFHAREGDRMLSGAAAFAAMWRAIPVLRPLGLAAQNAIVLALLEKLYNGFLKLRPRLQRLARGMDKR